jgi:hypothetical protein
MRWLVIFAIASCHAGRDDATTTIEAYQRLVTKACGCKDVACASSTDWEWVGAPAPKHASEATETWLLQLRLHFDQCLRRARGEPYEIVEY